MSFCTIGSGDKKTQWHNAFSIFLFIVFKKVQYKILWMQVERLVDEEPQNLVLQYVS